MIVLFKVVSHRLFSDAFIHCQSVTTDTTQLLSGWHLFSAHKDYEIESTDATDMW